MTEQQICKLKALLDASNTPENSSELDDKILKQAKRPAQPAGFSFFARSHSLLLSNSATAFSAVILTLVILFGLAEMTSVNDPANSLANSPIHVEAIRDSARSKLETSHAKSSYLEPSIRPADFPISSNFGDDLLSDIELPSTQQLLDNMHLPIDKDRLYAEQAITQALGEINHLLQNGNLQNARVRYQQLRNGCGPCKLPQTLEALAHIHSTEIDSG